MEDEKSAMSNRREDAGESQNAFTSFDPAGLVGTEKRLRISLRGETCVLLWSIGRI
jgi:hypothetical protein